MNLIGNIKKSITYYWVPIQSGQAMKFTTVDLKCTWGKRLVSWLHKIFCEAWPSNQIQLKSCSLLNGKALSSTMDCSRLCTASAGHLVIVSLEGGSATDNDNFAPA